jgi:hypothetical protein
MDAEKIITRPTMGEQRTLTSQVVKKKEYIGGGKRNLEWVEKSIEPVSGIFIGYRRVSNGVVVHEGYEEGNVFYPRKGDSHEVWLFVTSPRKNPIWCFPESLTDLP